LTITGRTLSEANMLSRVEVRQLKSSVRRESSTESAERLLADSVQKGHDKLALHRYLALHRLDASRCEKYEGYCRQVAGRLSGEALLRILRHAGWIG